MSPDILRRYGHRGPKYPVPDERHLVVAVDLGKHKVGMAWGWVATDGAAELRGACTVFDENTPYGVANAIRRIVADLPSIRVMWNNLPPIIWVCEWPQKYDRAPKYHENIEALHAVGNATADWSERYYPAEWKGQVRKCAHHRRVARALTPSELEVMPPKREHDAWDAAGIWLFAVGRTRRGGVQ